MELPIYIVISRAAFIFMRFNVAANIHHIDTLHYILHMDMDVNIYTLYNCIALALDNVRPVPS